MKRIWSESEIAARRRRWMADFRRAAGRARRRTNARGIDRGDVPGWVMIAVMTAALVMAILVPFRSAIIPAMTGAIEDMFGQAR